jgi:hypothetical protein
MFAHTQGLAMNSMKNTGVPAGPLAVGQQSTGGVSAELSDDILESIAAGGVVALVPVAWWIVRERQARMPSRGVANGRRTI